MFGGLAVFEEPQQYPRGREKPGDQKGRVPAKAIGRQGHKECGQDHANIGATVEDAERERALFLRKPLGIRFVGGRKVAGFANSKKGARDAELKHGVDQRMAHGGEAPEGHDDHVADARADLIDKAPRAELAERIEEGKECDDGPVSSLRSGRCHGWQRSA